MSWNKIKPKIKHLGYCCEFAFFAANRSVPTPELALMLNVTNRTVRYARHKFARNKLLCTTTQSCFRLAEERLRQQADSSHEP